MLVVDDSIVRGNTTMMLVDAIRRAGANHVFVALSEDRKGGGRGHRRRFRALSELGGLEAGVSRCGVV